MQGVFAASSILVLFINLRSQLYHDCIHTFKWRAKENKNVCHAFKKFKRKEKEKYKFSMHKHSRASPRERQYSILFVGPEAWETVTFILRRLGYLHPLISVSTPSHWITCLRTSQWLTGAPVWEQYGDRKSSFQNLTWEQGGARRGEIIMGSGTSFPVALLHWDNLLSTKQRWIQDYLLY